MSHETSVALLIDADNCPAAKIEVILDELAKYGVINIRRAYGNWKSTGLKGWEEVLHDYAIQPIQQFAYTKGKNATDSAMIIDAMDLLYTQKLDAFCLASSDSDFTPLVMRIRANGLKVFGFGEKKTPMPFVNACSRFLYLENLGLPEPESDAPAEKNVPQPAQARAASATSHPDEPPKAVATPQKQGAKALKGDAKLVNLLRKSVEAEADEDGWAPLSAVGSHISKQASFDPRNYGYKKLSDLVQAIDLFEVRKAHNHYYLRDKRAARPKGAEPAPVAGA
ncbi:MAG: NYN domain-containing protein [Rhodocyclaceae bacterium]|jgi:uncharacterized LabA/DUF88 family protein|nr:NYN domain-containing protein [Rhodocyclaceae bacterium]